jgi:hypothetical protein
MGLTAWRLVKILLAGAVLVASAYYSLRSRVETEIGPWEQWVRMDPTSREANPTKPKNLQGRFWTGIPRAKAVDIGRIDRHGYSLGYSQSGGGAAWAATFLPGDKVSNNSGVSQGIWEDDPEIPIKKGAERRRKGGQLVPGWLMDSFYGYGADTWYRSNMVEFAEKTMEDWNTHLGVIADYAAIYGGVVAFFGPYSSDSGRGFFSLVLRRGERGPEVLGFILREKPEGGLAGGTATVGDIEKITNLVFFADLPSEWRTYLRKKRAGRAWPQ